MIKKYVSTILLSMFLLCGLFSLPVAADSGNWVNTQERWWYQYDTGTWPVSKWESIQNNWYHFGADGYRQTGWLSDNGSWYFLADSGIMQTGWLSSNGSWYFLADSGIMQTGWLSNNGSWYFLADSGIMQTGWIQNGGSWYFLATDGTMQTGWVDNGSAFCDNSGIWIADYAVAAASTSSESSALERVIRANLTTIGSVTEEEKNAYVLELLKAPEIIHSNIKTYVLTEYDSAYTLNYLLGSGSLKNSRPESGTVGMTYWELTRYGSRINSSQTTYLIVTANHINTSTLHEMGHSAINFVTGLMTEPALSSRVRQTVSDYYNYSSYCRQEQEWYAETFMNYMQDPAALSSVSPEAYAYYKALETYYAAAKERNDLAAVTH